MPAREGQIHEAFFVIEQLALGSTEVVAAFYVLSHSYFGRWEVTTAFKHSSQTQS